MGKKSSKSLLEGCHDSWWEIYLILQELYMSTFKWIDMPPEINTRYLELKLFETGQVVFFNDPDLATEFFDGYVTLHATIAGTFDVYFEATRVNVIGGNGYFNERTNHKDCVVIYNNNVRSIPSARMEQYAKRIYNLERTIDVNVQAQKTPVAVRVKNNKLLTTMKTIMEQVVTYEPFIFVDEDVNIEEAVKSIDTKAPFVAMDLEEIKRKLWNEALSFIGIENNFGEKKERLTADEVLVSNGLAIANKNSRLLARNRAVEEINRMFNVNISVEVNNIGMIENEGGEFIE